MPGARQKRNATNAQVELKSRPKREKGLGGSCLVNLPVAYHVLECRIPAESQLTPAAHLGYPWQVSHFPPLYRSDKEGQENSSFPRSPASLVIGSPYQVFLIAELGPFLVQHTTAEVGTWKSTEHPSTRRRDGKGTGCWYKTVLFPLGVDGLPEKWAKS